MRVTSASIAVALLVVTLCGCGREASRAAQGTATPSPAAAAAASSAATPATAAVDATATATPPPTATATPGPPLSAEDYLTRRREIGAAIGTALQTLLTTSGGPDDAAWRDTVRGAFADLRQRIADARALQPPPCLTAGRQLDQQAFDALLAAADTAFQGMLRAEGPMAGEGRRLLDEAIARARAALAPLRTAEVAYETARC